MKEYFKGRGSQYNPFNRFLKNKLVTEHIEGLDEEMLENTDTEYFEEHARKVVNKVKSPDIGAGYSMNPYQGCEHGCIYCYARNTHEYYGFSAGLDFERKIIIKHDMAEVLEKQLRKPNWEVAPIMLSGNTDCYQPVERKMKITRRVLEVLLKYKHPVGLITKNSLILRDMDLLKELAKLQLAVVSVSITGLNEDLRQKMEPRTASYKKRLQVVEQLSKAGIPVNVMIAPIIPSLNSHEIPEVMKAIADAGASSAGFTIVRLNGQIGNIFTDWIHKNFPDRAEKVLHQIADCHGGKLNDSRFGTRMRGEGEIAKSIRDLFHTSRKKYLAGRSIPALRTDLFVRTKNGQMSLL